MRNPELLVRRSDVLTAEGVEGEIRCNIGDSATGEGEGTQIGVWGSDGFISCPNEPDDDGACENLSIADGTGKKIIATRDNRYAAKTGSPLPGDRFVVSNCDARLLLKKATNAITLYTVNEKDGNSSMLVTLGGVDGELQLLNGGAYVLLKKDEITLAVNGGGSIIIDKEGVQIGGTKFSANASTVTIGLVAGQPPLPGVNSALIGPAGISGIPSASVTIAP